MKILISNRGECALRINRAAQQLGHQTVAVYAKGDDAQLHLQSADETLCIGEASASHSYLNINHIITAAKITKADAIHPGYGFLAESSLMAKAAEEANLKWIGPPSNCMQLLSDKSKGRAIAQSNGMKVVSGSLISTKLSELRKSADEIGYPVLLKAANGGGGKGLRIIHQTASWPELFALCQQETKQAYGTDTFLVEKYLHQPKHIEVQVLVANDNTAHILGYRDCSIQKKHQKIIEESYFPSLHDIDTSELEHQIKNMLKSIQYRGLGTLEYLVLDKKWYFIEMNVRMQVEHTVTECQLGIDLIQHQISIGLGGQTALPKETSSLHAIQCRINLNSFSQGNLVKQLRWPGGCQVRIDSHLYAGYKIPPHYDAMIAKLITYDQTRAQAIKRMEIALAECMIASIDHNITELKTLLQNPLFQTGLHHTQLL